MKRIILFALTALLALTAAGGAFAEKYNAMPEIFIFRQFSTKETIGKIDVRTCLPDCSHDGVDAEMRALIEGMGARTLDLTKTQKPDRIDTGAYAFRSGESAMSFLTTSFARKDDIQTYVAFDARVYDLSDGRRLRLTDLILPDGAVWAMLANAVRDTVTAYFPDAAPLKEALDAACAREALEDAGFTVTPARLVLHYHAGDFYPGRENLIHVAIPHRLWRGSMTDLALRQTDCSRFKCVALTYDDGPALGTSDRVMDALRAFGATATFFCLGDRVKGCQAVLAREHDALFSPQSHSYRHEYKITPATAAEWVEKTDALFKQIIGIGPTMMRAPGGNTRHYVSAQVPLPLIGWNLESQDIKFTRDYEIARRVTTTAGDGRIVLMHDINSLSPSYTQLIAEQLAAKGFLCVTVEELFELYGIPLEASIVYTGNETHDAALAMQ